MFTPSATRIAAPTAREWAYVDSWLEQYFHGKTPSFERNADTLRTLMALATHTEAATEQQRVVHKVEHEAATELAAKATPTAATGEALKQTLLTIIEHALSAEGRMALRSLASAHLCPDAILTDARTTLGYLSLDIQAANFANRAMAERTEAMESQLEREARHVHELIQSLEDSHIAHLKAANANVRESVNKLIAQVSTAERGAGKLSRTARVTVDDIVREEQEYLALLDRKKQLDYYIAAFQGLPPDPVKAETELQSLRSQLQDMVSQRDAAFEGLVQRESPGKRK